MKQSSRLILTIIFFLGLITVARYITGRWFYLPSGDENLWFQSGLLMVVLGSFFIEKHFTKPVDVVANVTASIVTLLTIEHKENFVFWSYIFYGLLCLGLLAFLSMAIQSFTEKEILLKVGRVFYNIATFFGNAKRLFSIILFLALISYFEIPSQSSLVLFIFWAAVIVAEPIGIPGLIDRIINSFKQKEQAIGKVYRVLGDSTYQIEIERDIKLADDTLLEIKVEQDITYCIPLKTIGLSNKKLITAVKILSSSVNHDVNSESYTSPIKQEGNVHIISENQPPGVLTNKAFLERKNIVGTVEDNSDIAELRFKLLSSHELGEGQLVKVYLYGKPVIYQIVNAITKSEQCATDEEKFILVVAQQVGIWSEDSCRFDSIGWVAQPGSIVFAESEAAISLSTLDSERHVIGKLPNSQYPIHVDINEIVTHHTAILGITGSGKTFLAYDLIKRMVATGIKVLVFDISRDYWKDLSGVAGAKKLNSTGDVVTFLGSTSDMLGIAEFQPTNTTTIVKATAESVKAVLEWAKINLESQQGENIKAKVCVVFEEAHSLIPEWNTVSIPSDKEEVNKISQAILQGRKYGFGALVITQRTANITKTILNQCNTVFALQSFDQTGLEFLKNYIGEGHAHALSTLLRRQAVVFGKASSSRRPVIVKLDEKPLTRSSDMVLEIADESIGTEITSISDNQ